MHGTVWMSLEEAVSFLGVPYKRLWDFIMGRVEGKRLTVYRLAGGDELRLKREELLGLLDPVSDMDELVALEKRPARPRPPGHLF